jgi:tetratricopeptide (TPR) repeat protein
MAEHGKKQKWDKMIPSSRKFLPSHLAGKFRLPILPIFGLLLSVILGVTLWGGQAVGMIANNLWSIEFTHYQLGQTASVPLPPSHHPRAALWMARDALSHHSPALAQKLVAAQADKGNQYAQRILADAYQAQGEFLLAVEAWLQAGDYKSLLLAAQAAQLDGRPDDALKALRAACKLNLEKGALPLAVFLWDANNQSDAEALIKQALVDYPYSSLHFDWMRQLGIFYRQQSRWDQAESTFLELLKENPQDAQAAVELGWLLYERGDGSDDAIAVFQQAIAIDPSLGRAYLAIGQVLSKDGRAVEADAWYAQAIERNPDEKTWWLLRANKARIAGHLDSALLVYQQLTSRFPNWAPGYYEMALAYQKGNQVEEAVKAIEKALILVSPQDINYFIRAGGIYEASGQMEKAQWAYRQTLLLDPQNKSALAGLKRVQPAQ